MKHTFLVLITLTLFSCDSANIKNETAEQYPYQTRDQVPAMAFLSHNETYNLEAVIPPQCYTKTNGENNPCYVCHQTYQQPRPNIMHDGSLQGNYEFSDLGSTNQWKNLFVNRQEKAQQITDEDIVSWVNQDNYQSFIKRLKQNKHWQGEVTPIENLADGSKAFDLQGVALDGSRWVAYNYKPFPSTFWPTNGSTGDSMIRLPAQFGEVNGIFSKAVYLANLSLVEMAIKDIDYIQILPLSEKKLKQDLNGDLLLESAITQLPRQSHYLGDASHIPLSPMLFPQGTEFLHTVRYIGVDEQQRVSMSKRMKEVRYMKKHQFKTPQRLATAYYAEAKEKHFENLPQTRFNGDSGINNGFGWTINAYIEDAKGELRQQNKEELSFCNGCHKSIGSTIDQTFSFARKVDGREGWGYVDLTKMSDVPNWNDATNQGEYLTYMQRVGGGDEFRQNQEMLSRWFLANGEVNREKVDKVASLFELIMPSAKRALALNKAYKTIVEEQSFIFGRDVLLTKPNNVLKQIDQEQPPLKENRQFSYDIRLKWDNSSSVVSKIAIDSTNTE